MNEKMPVIDRINADHDANQNAAHATSAQERKMPAKPDLDHRSWVANLKEGDRVEVPYSLAKGDIKLMTVYKNDGVWIRLLPDGFRNAVENTVLVDAVSGVLHYASARIVPQERRSRSKTPMTEQRNCLRT
jgi:hypothetical protein